jgi:hypothetical protein
VSAHDKAVWAATGLMSALLALVLGYCVIAPALAWLNGERFKQESRPLAEAEAARWKAFKTDGEWPDEVPAAKRVDRIVSTVRRPLHRLKTRKDQKGEQ